MAPRYDTTSSRSTVAVITSTSFNPNCAPCARCRKLLLHMSAGTLPCQESRLRHIIVHVKHSHGE